MIESGNVSLSSCQERCCIVLLRCLCVGETLEMNQFRSKGIREGINTNLLAAISTQESHAFVCVCGCASEIAILN